MVMSRELTQNDYQKIMINWKPEGRERRGRPRRTFTDGIYTAMGERDVRMGEWNSRRQWNVEVGRRRQTALHSVSLHFTFR